MTTPLNIGEAARASGVSSKMIRHYESLGLVAPAARSDAGYRRFGERELETLRFIRHARALGFSLAEVGELLALWHDRARASRDVKRLAQVHLAALDAKLREIEAMKGALQTLVRGCHGDERPDCPIIERLAGNGPAPDRERDHDHDHGHGHDTSDNAPVAAPRRRSR